MKPPTNQTIKTGPATRVRTGVTPGGRPYMAERSGKGKQAFKSTDVALGRGKFAQAGPKTSKVKMPGRAPQKFVKAHDMAPARAIVKGPTVSAAAARKSKSGNFTKGK